MPGEAGFEQSWQRLLRLLQALRWLQQTGKAAVQVADLDPNRVGRVVRGDYGECVDCAGPVDARRRDMYPAALLCIHCAAAREQG